MYIHIFFRPSTFPGGAPTWLTHKLLCSSGLRRYPAAAPPASVAFIQRAKMNRILLEGVLSVARVAHGPPSFASAGPLRPRRWMNPYSFCLALGAAGLTAMAATGSGQHAATATWAMVTQGAGTVLPATATPATPLTDMPTAAEDCCAPRPSRRPGSGSPCSWVSRGRVAGAADCRGGTDVRGLVCRGWRAV